MKRGLFSIPYSSLSVLDSVTASPAIVEPQVTTCSRILGKSEGLMPATSNEIEPRLLLISINVVIKAVVCLVVYSTS